MGLAVVTSHSASSVTVHSVDLRWVDVSFFHCLQDCCQYAHAVVVRAHQMMSIVCLAVADNLTVDLRSASCASALLRL